MGFALSYKELEKISINSGAICVFDAYDVSAVKPFKQKFKTGEVVPYFLSVSTSIGKRVAFAGLKFSDEEPVVWKLALFEDKDVIKLSAEDNSVVSVVDSGIVGIGDYIAMREYGSSALNSDDEPNPMDRVVKFDGSTAMNFCKDDKPLFSVFSSGWGDGNYASYIGLNAKNEPVNLICDFNMLEAPKKEDNGNKVSFTFDINIEQMYQFDPRITADENHINKWSLVIENKNEVDSMTLYKAYSRRGYSYHNMGKLELALEDYYKALKILQVLEKDKSFRTHEWSLYDNAGTINKELGNLEEAKKLFIKAKEVGDSFYSGAYLNLIEIYVAEKNYVMALEICNEMIQSRPSDPIGYIKRAELNAINENYEKAILDYDVLIDKFQWEEGILEKTSTLVSMNRFADAKKCLETYIVDNKPNEFYYYNRGFLEYKTYNYSLSYEYLLRAYEYNPEFKPTLHLLVEIEERFLDLEKLQFWADKYIEISPQSIYGYSMKAVSCFKQKKYSEAIKNYEYIIANLSDDLIYVRGLIAACIYNGEFFKAKMLTKRLKKIDYPLYENVTGIFFLCKRKFAAADKYLSNALKAFKSEDYYADLIELNIKNANTEKATKLISELEKFSPDSPLPLIFKIRILKNNDSEEFKKLTQEYFEKFLPNIKDEEIIQKVTSRLKMNNLA